MDRDRRVRELIVCIDDASKQVLYPDQRYGYGAFSWQKELIGAMLLQVKAKRSDYCARDEQLVPIPVRNRSCVRQWSREASGRCHDGIYKGLCGARPEVSGDRPATYYWLTAKHQTSLRRSIESASGSLDAMLHVIETRQKATTDKHALAGDAL